MFIQDTKQMAAAIELKSETFANGLNRLIRGTLSPTSDPDFFQGGVLRRLVDTFLGMKKLGWVKGSAGEYTLETLKFRPLSWRCTPHFFGGEDETSRRKQNAPQTLRQDAARYFHLDCGATPILSWRGGALTAGTPETITWHAGATNTRRSEIIELLGGLDLEPIQRPTEIIINGERRVLYWASEEDGGQSNKVRFHLDRGPVIIYQDESMPKDFRVGLDSKTLQTTLDLRREGWALSAIYLASNGTIEKIVPIKIPAKLPWQELDSATKALLAIEKMQD